MEDSTLSPPARNFTCAVVFIDIIEYSKKPVARQLVIKSRFNEIIEKGLKSVTSEDRIILDTGDGAALCFLNDPEPALFVTNSIRNDFAIETVVPELKVRIGINLGPVKLKCDLNGKQNIVGDAINAAQRIMSFAERDQVLVSRSFHDFVFQLREEYQNIFSPEREQADKHDRIHTYHLLIDPQVPAIEVFRWSIENRHRLTTVARAYYKEHAHPDFPVITKAEWLPEHPIPLAEIDEQFRNNWMSSEPEHALPVLRVFEGDSYARLLSRIAPDVRQEDKFCYRLVEVKSDSMGLKLVFSPSRYSQFVSSCAVLGFELAEWILQNQQKGKGDAIPQTNGKDLVARGSPECIFDLQNRSACAGTSAVFFLLNTGKGNFFYLHKRESPQLLDSPRGWHVVPSGQFQPDTFEDINHSRDFSITRTVMREFAEELLGVKEVEEAIVNYCDFYDDPRMVPFIAGMKSGAVRLYFMGLGFDPVPTKPGFYIALVIDAARMPADSLKFIANWEGKHVAVPLGDLEKWSKDSRMIPDGATCLRLALRHFEFLVPRNMIPKE